MRTLKNLGIIGIVICSLIANACSSDDFLSSQEENGVSTIKGNDRALDFVAVLTAEQKDNLQKTGNIFLPEQQKDSWNTVIDGDIPPSLGVFESPFKVKNSSETRAVGIWGSYPAQYWTMIRLKNGELPPRILNAMVLAVREMESKTNVRFYNSSKDDESINVGGTTIMLPNVKVNMMENEDTEIEGAGNFGLIGGEQRIYVPQEFVNTSYKNEELVAFFLHAFCNAAGMFNEQQRKDRDDYVQLFPENIKNNCMVCFEKQNNNYTMLGAFDYHSITMASSKSYSKNGKTTILKKGGGELMRNLSLSQLDINFLTSHYLPYLARTDNYIEFDTNVYYNGRLLTEEERLQLQRDLNAQRGLYGEPPIENRVIRKTWQ